MKKHYWEEVLVALSLANLLFIGGWRRLIYPTSHVYHIKETPSALDYLSLILLVFIVAGIFVGGVWLVRYLFKRETPFFVRLVFIAIFFCALNAMRITFYEYQTLLINTIGRTALLAILGVVGFAGLITIVRMKGNFLSFVRSLVLILSPFVLITFSQSVLGIISAGGETVNEIAFQHSKENVSTESGIKSRVIWIIFDEMDYKVPFEIRPDDVKMPEFDRLKGESLGATKARSPNYETLQSIPSLITGKMVEKAIPYSKDELVLNFSGSEEKAKFSETDTVFSRVRELGGESAVVGWYHSYCRVFAKDLSACHWESFDYENDFKSQSLRESIQRDLNNLFLSMPLAVRFMKNFTSDDYTNRHERMVSATKEIVKNPEIDLALIHLPMPHSPYHFSRKQGKFVGSGDYLDNLVLADRTLGEIRQKLEENNLWDDSVVIVSSDHQWRLNQLKLSLTAKEIELTKGKEDKRIPFFVKLERQTESFEYEEAFNTVITKDLVIQILNGEITTSIDLENWLKNKKDSGLRR